LADWLVSWENGVEYAGDLPAQGPQLAGGGCEGRESMEHPKFEREFGCLPQLRSSEVFGGPRRGG